MANEITRRNFIKGAAAAAIAVSLSGVLTGCGGLADNEVELGSFTAKVSNAVTHWGGDSLGGNSNYVDADVLLTLNGKGSNFVSESYKGMFTGKVNNTAMTTVSPSANSNLVASDMAILGAFLKKQEVKLRMDFKNQASFDAFKGGAPIQLTITISGISDVLYMYYNEVGYITVTKTIAN